MATYGQTIRRGLPRLPGGDPWPPAPGSAVPAENGLVPAESGLVPAESGLVSAESGFIPAPAPIAADSGSAQGDGNGAGAPAAVRIAGDGARTIRRGLPRVPGGEPWPPAASILAESAFAPSVSANERTPGGERAHSRQETSALSEGTRAPSGSERVTEDRGRPLRRGLPRTPGGEPWPPAGSAPARTEVTADVASTPAMRHEVTPPPAPAHPAAASLVPAHPAAASVVPATDLSVPLPFTRTVFPGRAAVAFEQERLSGERITAPEPQRIGPFTRLQWLGAAIVGGGGLVFAAGMAVVAVRWLLSLEPMQEFLTAYPGEYELPEGAPVGIPPWLGWQHFFNVFLMVLIIRTGLRVRTEKRPSVFWSPRNNGKRKISLNLWFHQALDILWVTNGVIFVVLLFVTGQWMKLVPTSWAVFPNALSAALQYVSLDWPTENGWVNYNSLQQLAYFATVFIAAPLAIATGVRMSGIWPKNATALNKAYPVEWARAVHFPVMLYFVAFIIVHVTLVFATNALRNLNHMYASQDAASWVGFWIFAASLVVIAAGWVAARPLVLAPIARLFGSVSSR